MIIKPFLSVIVFSLFSDMISAGNHIYSKHAGGKSASE